MLTKDNLIKKGWRGKHGCVYCGQNATIDHLCFTCSAAKLLWSLIKCSFNLKTCPKWTYDCLGPWVRSFVDREKKLVLVGISAIMWAIWKFRNDITFRDRMINDPMTLIKLTCICWLIGLFCRRKKNRAKSSAGGKANRASSK